MPTYEYACRACGHTFEIVQSMKDDSLTDCPECGGLLRKVFAPPVITFKGTGFYATDHRQKAKSGDDKEGGGEPRPAAKGAGDTSSGDGTGTTTPSEPAAQKSSGGRPSSAGTDSSSGGTGSSSGGTGSSSEGSSSSGGGAPPTKKKEPSS